MDFLQLVSFGVTNLDWEAMDKRFDYKWWIGACVKASKSTTSLVSTTSVAESYWKSLLVLTTAAPGERVRSWLQAFAAVKGRTVN